MKEKTIIIALELIEREIQYQQRIVIKLEAKKWVKGNEATEYTYKDLRETSRDYIKELVLTKIDLGKELNRKQILKEIRK